LISIEGASPLGGVVHAAMVIEDALLRDMDRGQLHRVLAPKMLGALNCTKPRARMRSIFSCCIRRRRRCSAPRTGRLCRREPSVEALATNGAAKVFRSPASAGGPIGDAGYLRRSLH